MTDPSPTTPPAQGIISGPMLRLSTPSGKLVTIAGLLLVLQIPLWLVGGLIHERAQRALDVLALFGRGWGPEQTITGPLLLVPYDWRQGEQLQHGWARLAATQLHVAANLQPERRRRGLFQATIYTAAIDLAGTFQVPPLALMYPPGAVIDWRGARVQIGARDLRGVKADATLAWNGANVPLQTVDRRDCGLALLDAPAGLSAPPAPDAPIAFKATLALRGTQSFGLIPQARQTELSVTSSWRTPGFAGATLPLQYTIGDGGFDAHWDVPGDPAAAGWQTMPNCPDTRYDTRYLGRTSPDTEVGVELREAVPTYVMVDRAAKYGTFFLVLTFLTLFLFETLSRVAIHLVQYGLVGLSLSLFALLLIAIAEPLGFTVAYAISVAAVVAQASLYTLSVVRRRRLAAIFAAVLLSLFAFLYVVLSLDAYALLVGSVALFAALSVAMLATRRIDWSSGQAAA